MSDPAVDFRSASFSVTQGFFKKRKILITAVSVSIPPGQVFGLVGPNGAGKTTFIKLGTGLIEPQAGEIMVCGQPVSSAAAKKRIGLLTEKQYCYANMSLNEWLLLLSGLSGNMGGEIKDRREELLEFFDLSDRISQRMGTLSKGQLQRTGFVQAFMHNPEIIFLDEPMSGLDPYWRYKVRCFLSELKVKGKTIIFSSHIISDVEELSDQIGLMVNGTLKWQGAISQLQQAIKGYQVRCRTDNKPALISVAVKESVDILADGSYVFTLPSDNRSLLFGLINAGIIDLESFLPLREKTEELLFKFKAR
ncbi:MAG: ABC transporter ATP-binding protein [Pseudomonadota bacterium]